MSARTFEESYTALLHEELHDILVLAAAFLTEAAKVSDGFKSRDDIPDGELKEFLTNVADLAVSGGGL